MVQLETKSMGLYDGIVGQLICCKLQDKIFPNRLFEETAARCLEILGDNIANVQSLGFSDGLSGIGWGLEWLARHNFLQINTDEVLEEFDDVLYKSLIYSTWDDLTLSDGLQGLFLYFYSRYDSCNPGSHRYKTIFFEDILNVLINKFRDGLEIILKGDTSGLLDRKSMLTLVHAVYLFSGLPGRVISNESIESTFYTLISYMEEFLERFSDSSISESEQDENAAVHIACGYFLAGRNFSSRLWQKRALEFIEKRAGNTRNVLVELILSRQSSNFLSGNDELITLCSEKGGRLILDCYRQGVLDYDAAVSLILFQL